MPSFNKDSGFGQRTVTKPKPLKDYPPTTGAGTFVPASSDFGFRLLRKLTANDRAGSEGNVFISPLSLSLALTMTMDGADGVTRRDMQSTLGYPTQANASAIDSDAQAFLAQYAGSQISKDVEAQIASGLWPNTALPPDAGHLSPDFAARTTRIFGATVEAVDFSTGAGSRRVNSWTSEHTKGKIPAILPDRPLDKDTALVLTNAVYFKAKWNASFDVAATKPGVFTLASGQTKQVPLMSQTHELPYLKGAGFAAVQIPYDDGRFSMFVILPNPGVDLRTFAARQLASAEQWNGYLTQFGRTKVALQLPRFKIAYTAEGLTPCLKSLGMTAPFNWSTDFRPMGYVRGRIGEVLHKTTLVVDEAGSEATAVTAVVMMAGAAAMPRPIIPFVVDRPFFCAIRDNATGALMFLGRITDPDTT